jgi:hypothetical protein
VSAREIVHLVAEDDRLRQRIDADEKRRREVQTRLSELRCPHPIGMEFVQSRGWKSQRTRRFRVVSYAPCGPWDWRLIARPVLKDGTLGMHLRDCDYYPYSDITPDPKGDA